MADTENYLGKIIKYAREITKEINISRTSIIFRQIVRD